MQVVYYYDEQRYNVSKMLPSVMKMDAKLFENNVNEQILSDHSMFKYERPCIQYYTFDRRVYGVYW